MCISAIQHLVTPYPVHSDTNTVLSTEAIYTFLVSVPSVTHSTPAHTHTNAHIHLRTNNTHTHTHIHHIYTHNRCTHSTGTSTHTGTSITVYVADLGHTGAWDGLDRPGRLRGRKNRGTRNRCGGCERGEGLRVGWLRVADTKLSILHLGTQLG